MKKIYTICMALLITAFAGIDMLHAQAEPVEVTVRDLQTYENPLTSQADLRDHPLVGDLVTFDAVVVSYPKNSGLASITSAGVPGRIHVFVTDVKAAEMGPDGMSIQVVVDGVNRETLEALIVGDVIRVVGKLTFFSNVSQFATSEVTQLGNVTLDEEYEDLADLLEPTVVDLSEINIPSDTEGRHTWNSEAYSKYNHRYVKIEGLEVIDRIDGPTGRPWFVLSDGTTVLYSNDTSLRFRNDRGFGYAFNDNASLNYNWRRLSEDLDGPFAPPPAGAIVDISGYILVNTFNPAGFDESSVQSTLKIAPWDDGIRWTQDGDDTDFRFTEEDGVNNDLVVVGFPALIDDVDLSVDEVTSSDEVTITAEILLPEDDYTLGDVTITYEALSYDEDTTEEVTGTMTGAGSTFSFTFPAFGDFTDVSYTISANATTPDNVQTTGRYSDSYYVANDDVTAPVAFSPAAGSYENIVEVTLSSPTEGAVIYFTLDGTDPTAESTSYTTAISLDETTSVKAIAVASGLETSPINSRTYTVVAAAVEVSTLAALRTEYDAASTDVYSFTGDAVVTYARSSRNQKYIMDSTGGMLIDDSPGVITTPYAIGDVMTGALGALGAFNELVQFLPSADVPSSGRTTEVVPFEVTIDELNVTKHESALVTINNVRFDGATGDFVASRNLTIKDSDGTELTFRTNFSESDYIGQAIPTAAFNLTALVGNFRGTLQVFARSTADFNFDVSNERFDGAYEFTLSQNYPNPFNPTTAIVYSVAEMSNVRLTIYDILGRVVTTLVNDVHSPGQYNVNFDATQLSSGTYIYRIEAGDFMSTKKMLLIK